MATLYVANTTKQHQEFTYRLPEESRPRSIAIRVGQQVRIGDLQMGTIEQIVKQMLPYGIKAVSEVSSTRDYVGLCYSVDKAVPLNNERLLNDTFVHNDEVLNDRAEERREASAAAVATDIQNTMSQHGVGVPRAEVEVIEETRGTPTLARGYEVVADGARPRHDGKRSTRADRRRNER